MNRIKKFISERFRAMITELAKPNYPYGCVMLYLKVNKSYWDKIQDLIDNDDVATVDGVNGREKFGDVHVTLLYGLHRTVSDDDIEEMVKNFKIDDIQLKTISTFTGGPTDVLKFSVKGKFLFDANKELKTLKHTSTHPKYIPHVTIAYLKKGKGEKYEQTLKGDLAKLVKAKHFVYSKPDGTKKIFKLKHD